MMKRNLIVGKQVIDAGGGISDLTAGEEQLLQKWLREIFGWSSVQTYTFAVHKETGKSLSEIREELMNQDNKVNESMRN